MRIIEIFRPLLTPTQNINTRLEVENYAKNLEDIFTNADQPNARFVVSSSLDPHIQCSLYEAFFLAAQPEDLRDRIDLSDESLTYDTTEGSRYVTRACQLVGMLRAINALRQPAVRAADINDLFHRALFRLASLHYKLPAPTDHILTKKLSHLLGDQIKIFARGSELSDWKLRRAWLLTLINEIRDMRLQSPPPTPRPYYAYHLDEHSCLGDLILKNLCLTVISMSTVDELANVILDPETTKEISAKLEEPHNPHLR